MKGLSVIIPCYNCSGTLPVLTDRLSAIFKINSVEYEIILVNDASDDDTFVVIKQLAERDKNIIGIDLEYNAGQEFATLCGLEHATGEMCATMDCDLQHTPEGLMVLYQAMKAHPETEVVIASFPKKKHNSIRNLFTLIMKKIRNSAISKSKGIEFTGFRILRKEIVSRIVLLDIGFPKIGLMALMVADSVMNVSVEHSKRTIGRSTYSVSKLFRSFINFLHYYTSFPVKMVLITAWLLLIITLGYLIFALNGTIISYWLLIALLVMDTLFLFVTTYLIYTYVTIISAKQKFRGRYVIKEIIRLT